MKSSYNEILLNTKETNYGDKREVGWIPKSSWVKEARQKRLHFTITKVIAMLMVKKKLTAIVLKETISWLLNSWLHSMKEKGLYSPLQRVDALPLEV